MSYAEHLLRAEIRELRVERDHALYDAVVILDGHLHRRDCGLPPGHCHPCERWDAAADRIEARRKAATQ